MALNQAFDEALADEWRTLERRLRLLKTFGLIVLFVRDGRLAQGLKLKVAAWLAERQLDWAEVALDTPDGVTQAAQATLSSLFDQMRGGERHLAWLEAHTRAGQPAWDAERRELLRRLNERRSRLEIELPGAFILLLPEKGVRDIATMAPDLWHVRIHTADLRFDGQAASVATMTSVEKWPQTKPVPAQSSVGLLFWRQQWQAWRAAVGPDPIVPDAALLYQISLWDGWKAVDECLARDQLQEAAEIAYDVLGVARVRLNAAGGAGDTALREVAVALEQVGNVAAAAGEFKTAQDFYTQSVAVHRSLSTDAAPYDLSQRDLAVALSNVAAMAIQLEHWAQAEAATQEALSLFRAAAPRATNPTQARRDLIAALARLGDIHEARADWRRAQRCHQEALELARRALEQDRTPEGPSREAAHYLLFALNNLARVALVQGDWSAAEALAEESQARAREHLRLNAGDFSLTSDLTLALDLIASVARQLGETGRAEMAERERQTLIEALAASTDDNPPNLTPPSSIP